MKKTFLRFRASCSFENLRLRESHVLSVGDFYPFPPTRLKVNEFRNPYDEQTVLPIIVQNRATKVRFLSRIYSSSCSPQNQWYVVGFSTSEQAYPADAQLRIS